jgi:hypothetical protein
MYKIYTKQVNVFTVRITMGISTSKVINGIYFTLYYMSHFTEIIVGGS